MGDKIEIAQRGRDDLFFLCKYILGYGDMEERPHSTVFAKFIEDIEGRPKDMQNGLLLCPRGSFKSSIAVIGYAVQRIIRDPNVRILLDGETYTKAANYVEAVKSHLRSEKFQYFYGDMITNAPRDREGELIVSTRNKSSLKESTIQASGVGKAITGMHVDVILFDDLVSKDNTGTQDQRKKVQDHFQLYFPILDPGGMILGVGTRWHMDDLYDFITREMREDFVIEVHKAIAENGELFFPSRLSTAYLSRQKHALGPSFYSSQYMNEPLSSEEQIFKPEMVQFYGDPKNAQALPRNINTFIQVDPSLGENPGNDSTGITVVGVDELDRWFILEAIQERLDPHTMAQTVIDFCKQYKPMKLVFEKQGVGGGLAEVLKDMAQKQGIALPWAEAKLSSKLSKSIRILSLEPIFAARRVYFPMSCAEELWGGFKHLYQLLMQFRVDVRPKKCDSLDSLSMAIPYAVPARKGRIVKSENKEFGTFNWDDEDISRRRDFETTSPASAVTGYY